MQRTSLAILGLLALTSTACGDDDERGRDRYESGVRDDDATASTLDEDEKQRFCSSFDAHVRVTVGFDELRRAGCLLQALLLGGSQQGCSERLDSCAKNPSSPIVVDARLDNQRRCYDSLQSCQASVGQLEACVNVSIDGVLDTLERVTCDRYGDDAAMRELEQAMGTAESCAELSGSCGDAVVLF